MGFCWDEVAITCLLLTKFPFGTEIRLSQKNQEGFGMDGMDGSPCRARYSADKYGFDNSL